MPRDPCPGHSRHRAFAVTEGAWQGNLPVRQGNLAQTENRNVVAETVPPAGLCPLPYAHSRTVNCMTLSQVSVLLCPYVTVGPHLICGPLQGHAAGVCVRVCVQQSMHRSSADRKGAAQSKRTPPPNSRSKRRFLFADSESDDDIVPQKVAAQPARGGALSPSDKWQRKLDHVQSKRTDISPTNRVQSRRADMSPTNRSLTPPPRPPRKTTPRADSYSTPRVPHTPPSTSVYSASPHTLRVRSELDAKAAASSQTRARASTSPPDHASSAGREKSVYATSSPARKDNSSPVSCGNCFRLEKEVEILRRTLAVERTAHDQELRDVTGELQEALDAERRTKAEVVSYVHSNPFAEQFFCGCHLVLSCDTRRFAGPTSSGSSFEHSGRKKKWH